MKTWITRGWKACRQRPVVTAQAFALAAALVIYSAIGPVKAGVSSNTAPLDNNQVGALLSLDHAMEAVAAEQGPMYDAKQAGRDRWATRWS